MSVHIQVEINNTETYTYEPRSFVDSPRDALSQLDTGYRLARTWLLDRCGSACEEKEKKPPVVEATSRIGFDAP